ncbi:MAG: FAD-dependent oxidoreductase, partial [Deinococcota bacterium]
SWFDFFDQYITPAVTQNILFDTVATSVNYSGDDIVVSTQAGQTFSAEKVIVTAPVKILQDGDITFVPKLPQRKVDALNDVTFWDGMKVFINFAEAFYPTFLEFADTERQLGDRVYYDAAYGRPTDASILGFFLIGEPVNRYKDLSDDALKIIILAELDEIFAGQASQHYISHISQVWSREPFIRGAYVRDSENWRRVAALGEPVAGKVYFAGDAYTDGDDWGFVHTAAQSAMNVVDVLVRGG